MTANTFTVKNTGPGLRGLHTVGGFVELEPNETRSVELTAAEFNSAKAAGYFDFGDAKAPTDEQADDLDTTVAKLKEVAEAEGVELPHNAAKGVIQQAIRDARAAKAKANEAPADALAEMDDATLRTTVEAITGQAPAADADRETLLKLARGEA